MDHGFIGLIWGFCAAITPPHEMPNTIRFGYKSENICIVKMTVGDTHKETFTVNEHAISIEILKGGAQINIDGQGFALIDILKA